MRLPILLNSLLLLIPAAGAAARQISLSAPAVWKSASPVGLDSSGMELPDNRRTALAREILDTNTIDLIAKSAALSEHESGLLAVAAPEAGGYQAGSEIWLYRLTDEWPEHCAQFARLLNRYVLARLDGHTRNCLLNAFTNQSDPASITAPGLKWFAVKYPELPIHRLKELDSGANTNRPGIKVVDSLTLKRDGGRMLMATNSHIPQTVEISRWWSYQLIDGDIAWTYRVTLKPDGSLKDISETRCDAKDVDPNYQIIMSEVAAAVSQRLRNGTNTGQGSIQSFWRLKQEELKGMGIEWRSPAELNPGTHFD